MKKYVSCVILIVLCIICAMIFYVHAKNNDDSIINGNSNTNTSTGSSDTTANGEPIEDVNIIEIDTTINVIVIHIIEAIDKDKFLNTLLKESLIFLPNILIAFILICSFLIIFYNSSRI